MSNPALVTYDRRYKVPAIDGTEPRVCGTCNEWFPARKRERTCYPCLPGAKRRNRLAKLTTFRASVVGTKPQVTLTAETVRSMALEASAQIDYPNARITGRKVRAEHRCPVNDSTPASLRRAHVRAITEGRQGCICGGLA